MTSNLTFGEYLKHLRLKKGFTLKKLADLAGLSPSYLSRIERGERNIPNARFLNSLAEHLSLSSQEIMIAAGYLNKEPGKASFNKDRGIGTDLWPWPEIVRDPALHAALEEIGTLSEKEKEGLLLFLKAIKLLRDKE